MQYEQESAPMQPNRREPEWYVLFVRSNQEWRVAQQLSSRAVENFLPTYESVRQWRDRKVTLHRPLFPGYVFVKLPFIERCKALLVPNVVNLVGPRNDPSVISNEEIEWIRLGMSHGKAQPHRCLNAGDWVVIKNGAMAGMQGILIRMQNGTRVLVQLDMISRAFSVEVESSWLDAGSRPRWLQRYSKDARSPGSPEILSRHN